VKDPANRTAMNTRFTAENSKTELAAGLAILGAFLIVAALVWAMRHYTQSAPLNAARAAERAAALRDLRASETAALQTTAWLDAGKGLVRLRIEDAMQLVEREWQDPAAGRSNLLARVDRANPPPPPSAPAKPNPFE
jgi:hypothetical protein